MGDDEQPIELSLTEEQQALIQRVTGEHASILQLTVNPTDGTSGTGCGLSFNWRISVDSGIPRQQWLKAVKPPRPGADAGT
jgi:hypothetical protein